MPAPLPPPAASLALANLARTLAATLVQVHQATEEQLLQAQCPAALPRAHVRVCLRWLVACGVLGRSFSLVQEYPPAPSLFSLDPYAGGGGGEAAAAPAPCLAALGAALGLPAPPSLAEAVQLWEAAPFAGSGGGAEAAGAASDPRAALLRALSCHHSGSPCPLPGLVTTYFASGMALTRLAALLGVVLGEGEAAGPAEAQGSAE